MARNAYRTTPDRPFIHAPIGGPDGLKAGTLVDASDVVTQIITLAGAGTRRRIHFKSAVTGVLSLEFMQPYGKASLVYDLPAIGTVAVTGNTAVVLELDATEWQGEGQALLTFTGDAGIGAPGAILYADLCGS